MLGTIITVVIEWASRQVERFGKWVLAIPVIILGLGIFLLVRAVGVGSQPSGWPTEAQQRAIDERAAAEDKIENDALAGQWAARKAREEQIQQAAAARLLATTAPLEPTPVPKQPDAAPAPKEPSPLDLPKDLADWKDDDFFIARHTGNKRLTAALAMRAKTRVGKTTEPTFLTSLLDPTVPEHLQDLLSRQAPGIAAQPISPSQLLGAVAAALGVNNTPAATEALAQMATGTLANLDPIAAANAALKAIAENTSPQNEAALLKILLAPQADGKPAADAQAVLRQRIVGLLKASASRRLRVDIARKMIDPATATETRALLLGIIKDSAPNNFDAQLVLYRGGLIDAATRTAIEKYYLTTGSDVLGWVLGMPDKANVGATPEWPQFVVRRLWRDEFAEQTRRRLDAARSLQEAANLIGLAATVPSDAMRQCLLETLVRHWEDGPGGLQTAPNATPPGLSMPAMPTFNAPAPTSSAPTSSALVFDPGWVIVLKTLERKVARAKSPAGGTGRQTSTVAAGRKQWEDFKIKAKDQWGRATEDAVRRQCAVFRSVALARDEAALVSGDGPTPQVKPPIPIHPNARVMTAVQLDFAEHCAVRTGGLQIDPLKVTYLRMEGRHSPLKLQQWYRRQLKGCDERKLTDGAWFDALVGGADGRKRSIDVRITQSPAIVGRPADEEREISVDVLVIEVRDPAPRLDASDNSESP